MPHGKGAKTHHHKPYKGPWPEEHHSVPGRAGKAAHEGARGDSHPAGAAHKTFQKVPAKGPKPSG